ncbi:MAG: hypothetical protein AB7P40_15815 [Chloroflexota bacterium]
MTYELWDLVSRNMIDWFEDQGDAVRAVQAYVDADEADDITLLMHDASEEAKSRSLTGSGLTDWLRTAQAELRRAS